MKNDPKIHSSLKLLTFQLSNVRELETIKYAFGSGENPLCFICYQYCFDAWLIITGIVFSILVVNVD